VITEGWIDWADSSTHGHPEKVYSQQNLGLGIICHSVVGNLPGHSVPDRFLSNAKEGGRFTAYSAASVQFILYRDGWLRQMYPITTSTWTSGGPEANTGYWSIEAEGGYPDTSEPLTVEATLTFFRLCAEFEVHTGRKLVPGVNLIGHRDAATRWGYAPTACPSGRYDVAFEFVRRMPPMDAYQLVTDVIDANARIDRIERVLAGWGGLSVTALADNANALKAVLGRDVKIGERVTLESRQAMAYLDLMQNNMWVGLGNIAARVEDHIANHAAGAAGPVQDHRHEFSIKGTTGGVVR